MGRHRSSGESAKARMFPKSERRSRPSTGVDEAGGSCRPCHCKRILLTISGNTTELLALVRTSLRYTQGDDFSCKQGAPSYFR